MKIGNISMVNFRSHSATTIAAPSGLVAVVGSNGAGKSNAIKALEFLVTGAVHGLAKESLLRWGASSGHVTGTIETDSDKVEIYRSVSSSTARLYVNGKEFAVGIRDVNAEMLRRFGVDKDIAKFVFTGQGEIDDLLFDPPPQRETAVLKLCGLADATVVHKVLGECMPLLVGAQNNHELQGQLVAMLAETDTNLSALRAAALANAARPEDAVCDNQEKLRVLACAAAQDLRVLRARVTTAAESKVSCEKLLAMTPAAGGDKSELLTLLAQAEKEHRHRGAKDALARAQEHYDSLQATLSLGEAELATLVNGMEPLSYRKSAEDLLARYSELLRQHNAFSAYAAGLDGARARIADVIKNVAREPERGLLLVHDGHGGHTVVAPGDALTAAIVELDRRLHAEVARLQSEAQVLHTELGIMRSASIDTRQMLLAGLSVAPYVECPTCASQVGQSAAHTIMAKIASARPAEQALNTAANAASGKASDMAMYSAALLSGLRHVEKAVAGMGPAPAKPDTSREEVVEATAALSSRLAQLGKLVMDVQLARHSSSAAATALQHAKDILNACPAVAELAAEPDAHIRKLLSSLPEQIAAMDRSAAAVVKARRDVDLAAATLAAATAALEQREASAVAELPAVLWRMLATDTQGGDLASWVSQQLRLEEELRKRRAALASLTAQLAAVEKQRAALAARIDAVAAQMLQDAPRQKLVEDITSIRDWFHYGSGPKRVAMSIMARMTHGVNELLQYMQAPFSVTLHGLEYRVRFLDGRTDALPDGADASELSGGQRVLLSIAVHFARYRMFASKLGILVLDEPTVYLDPSSVVSVCDALDKVRQLAHKLGMQIWLCTHEPVLLPVCDHVIEIKTGA